MVLLHNKDQQ